MLMPNFPIIELPIDSMDAFDYENAENAKYSVDDLRKILIDEIKVYERKRQAFQIRVSSQHQRLRSSKSP